MSCVINIAEAWVAPNMCAYQLPVDINQARSVVSVGTSDFLALERGSESVVYFWDSDGDGRADSSKIMVKAPSLNHGLVVQDNYIYASSSSHVYRWPIISTSDTSSPTTSPTAITNSTNSTSTTSLVFDPEMTTVGDAEVVIDNINRDGSGGAPFGHTTRTLAFDDQGRLYVSVGSDENVDPDSFRSRIRRFVLDDSDATSDFPLDFLEGEVFADGLRNEVGLAFDRHGDLWGVENSADRLARDDIGGDIHADNPAEELNRFKEEDVGKNWGYPKCWTEFLVPAPHGLGAGTVWAWPTFLEAGVATDDECRANTIPPVMSLQGHSAPLGITFYEWKAPEELPVNCPRNVAFPREMDGYAFLAYHGSWNRDIPTGYKIVYVEMDEIGEPIGSGPMDLLMHQPPSARWDNGLRPVDVDFDDCGRLLVSSDGSRNRDTGEYPGSGILRLEYASAGTFAPTISPTSVETIVDSTEGVDSTVSNLTADEKNTATGTEEDVKNDTPYDAEAPATDTSASSTTIGVTVDASSGANPVVTTQRSYTGLLMTAFVWAAWG